jgi:hypothetical protein
MCKNNGKFIVMDFEKLDCRNIIMYYVLKVFIKLFKKYKIPIQNIRKFDTFEKFDGNLQYHVLYSIMFIGYLF